MISEIPVSPPSQALEMADCSAWTEWNSPGPRTHVGAKVPGAAQAAGDGADEEPGDGATEQAAASGSRARRRALSSSPVAAFQGRDLVRGETGLEIVPSMGSRAAWSRAERVSKWLGKAGIHTVSSKANWGPL